MKEGVYMNNIYISEILYQAKVNLTNMEICGFEALVRFSNGTDILNTDKVIDSITSVSDKQLLTSYVINRIIEDTTKLHINKYRFAVNISTQEIEDISFKEWILNIKNKCKNINDIIEFEIIEKDFINDFNIFNENIKFLKQLGFYISLDDIGSGYNTLGMINNISNIDYIKIDRKIINSINTCNLVECILKIAKIKEIRVLAEGIEDYNTYKKLKDLNCDMGQGYFFHKPQSIKQIAKCTINEFIMPSESP